MEEPWYNVDNSTSISVDAGPTQDCVNDRRYVNLGKQREQHCKRKSEDDSEDESETFVKQTDLNSTELKDVGVNQSNRNGIPGAIHGIVDTSAVGAMASPLLEQRHQHHNHQEDYELYSRQLDRDVYSAEHCSNRRNNNSLLDSYASTEISATMASRTFDLDLFLITVEEEVIKRHKWKRFAEAIGYKMEIVRREIGHDPKNLYQLLVKWKYAMQQLNMDIVSYLCWALKTIEENELRMKLMQNAGLIEKVTSNDRRRLQEELKKVKFDITVNQKETTGPVNVFKARNIMCGDGNVQVVKEQESKSTTNDSSSDGETDTNLSTANMFYTDGLTESRGTLDRDGTPQIDVTKSPLEVCVGQNCVMKVNIKSNPEWYFMTWLKVINDNPEKLTECRRYGGGTLDNPSLEITNTAKSDEGFYRCQAVNAFGSGHSQDIFLRVIEKPQVDICDVPIALPGKAVTIECKIQPIETLVSLVWHKDGQRLPVHTHNSKYFGGTIQNPSLTIAQLEKADSGKYRCEAANAAGTVSSRVVNVSVADPPDVVITAEPIALRGSTWQVKCRIQSDIELTSVEWLKDGYKVTETSNIKIIIGDEPSLTIYNADTGDCGTYVCKAINMAGIGLSKEAVLEIGDLPVLRLYSSKYFARTKDIITIKCQLDGHPKPSKFAWYKSVNGDRIELVNTSTSRYSGGTLVLPSLTIKSANVMDTGFYECSACNRFGESRSENVYVKVEGEIPFIVIPDSISAKCNQPVTIACKISSNERLIRLNWYKDKIELPSNSRKYIEATIDSPSLTILKLCKSDEGKYTCKATNQYGTGESNEVYIDVCVEKPTITIPAEVYAKQDEQLTIDCKIVATPPVTSLEWFKLENGNPKPIKHANTRYSGGLMEHPEFTISKIQKNDEGNYICQARNIVGDSFSGPCSVIVHCKPSVEVDRKQITVKPGDLATIECKVKASLPVTNVTWYKLEGGVQRILRTDSTDNTDVRSSLTIKDVKISDMGKFICEVTNNAGTTRSDTIHLDVISDNELLILASEEDAKHIRKFQEDISEGRGSHQLHATECIFPNPVNEAFLDNVNTQLSSARAVFVLVSEEFISTCWPRLAKMPNLNDCLYGSRPKIIPVIIKFGVRLPMGMNSINYLCYHKRDTYYKIALSKLLQEFLPRTL